MYSRRYVSVRMHRYLSSVKLCPYLLICVCMCVCVCVMCAPVYMCISVNPHVFVGIYMCVLLCPCVSYVCEFVCVSVCVGMSVYMRH